MILSKSLANSVRRAPSNAVGAKVYTSNPRLQATLMSDARVRMILVANPFRLLPIRWPRKLTGARQAPFPTTPNCALVEPIRFRRRDPVSVAALERAYEDYDSSLDKAVKSLGTERPAIVATNPFAAGFLPFDGRAASRSMRGTIGPPCPQFVDGGQLTDRQSHEFTVLVEQWSESRRRYNEIVDVAFSSDR